jgi:hypothetical protein
MKTRSIVMVTSIPATIFVAVFMWVSVGMIPTKAEVISVLSSDGWRLVEESKSKVTFERKANPLTEIKMIFSTPEVAGKMREAVDRLTWEWRPWPQRWKWTWEEVSRTASGREFAYPVNNRRIKDYLSGVSERAKMEARLAKKGK